MFRRALSVLALLFALSAAADVRLWPFFYAKTDPVAHHNQLEVFWPLYSRDADEQSTVLRFLSFKREFPDHYPWQVYFLWPITALRLGNGHDAWLFLPLSGSDGDYRNHNSVFPFWIYYRNDDYRTLNLAILNHNSWSKQHHSHYSSRFGGLNGHIIATPSRPRTGCFRCTASIARMKTSLTVLSTFSGTGAAI